MPRIALRIAKNPRTGLLPPAIVVICPLTVSPAIETSVDRTTKPDPGAAGPKLNAFGAPPASVAFSKTLPPLSIAFWTLKTSAGNNPVGYTTVIGTAAQPAAANAIAAKQDKAKIENSLVFFKFASLHQQDQSS